MKQFIIDILSQAMSQALITYQEYTLKNFDKMMENVFPTIIESAVKASENIEDYVQARERLKNEIEECEEDLEELLETEDEDCANVKIAQAELDKARDNFAKTYVDFVDNKPLPF